MNDWIDNTPPANDIPSTYDWVNFSQEEKTNVIVVVVFFVAAFLLRKTKWFGWMWKGFGVIIFVLFASVFIDFVKNGVKKWWNS